MNGTRVNRLGTIAGWSDWGTCNVLLHLTIASRGWLSKPSLGWGWVQGNAILNSAHSVTPASQDQWRLGVQLRSPMCARPRPSHYTVGSSGVTRHGLTSTNHSLYSGDWTEGMHRLKAPIRSGGSVLSRGQSGVSGSFSHDTQP
ncbi:hypothetical protein DPEC_G00359990 [Dallia pectoralis]|uniref:Uncharacterized protein n=1 Tax=Dallia pectoralis TaxID=75939 RepID=A0ACC2F0R6_DALPE|nr:hypothetical protein DPEC_G00359990 [Dallia pectoralis]